MSKRHPELFAVDILVAIDKIERYSEDFVDAQEFYHDEKSFDATMRELQIIGEAAKHLINASILDSSHRIIVDFRNLIVHEYFGVDAEEIWEIVREELPIFKKTVLEICSQFDRELMSEILEDAIETAVGKSRKFLKELKTGLG